MNKVWGMFSGGIAFVVAAVTLSPASPSTARANTVRPGSQSHSTIPTGPSRGNEIAAIGDLHSSEHQLAEAEAAANTPMHPAPRFAVSSTAPDVIGAWGTPQTVGTTVVGIHSVVLKTGKVLMWSPHTIVQPDGTSEIQTMAAVYDPATNHAHRVDPPNDGNVFCGAGTILGDGTVAVVGGFSPYNGYTSRGIPAVLLFDPVSETWTWGQPMHKGRWYPTITETADGAAIVVGGRDAQGKANTDVEKITSNPLLAPQLLGTYNLDWQQGLYPNQFLMPNGQVFTYAGSRTDYLDLANWKVNPGPKPLAPEFDYPNAVVLPIKVGNPIQMVVYGGKNTFAGTNTAQSSRLNLSAAAQTFVALTPMPQPRSNMNSVLLPDGHILVVGGNGSLNYGVPYLQSLMYDPIADTWTPLASQVLRRAYHSTAVLLPDGRVLSAGDNGPVGAGANFIEIYSPPYLFKGTRPAITASPTSAAVGTNINVVTNSPIAKIVLIAPSATTHATDMHQRLVELSTTALVGGTNGLTASIPADGTLPPGPYMVFALNATGIPSIAQWIQIN